MLLTIYIQNLDMSNKSRKSVKEILDELCDYENVENYRQLAPLLDYSPDAVYKWADRNSIPVDNLSKKRPDLNRAFLLGKDAQIPNKDYLESGKLNSEDAVSINDRITEFLSSNDEVKHGSPTEKLLLAFRSQLKSQKSQVDTMIRFLDMVLKKNHSDN